jgi:hypothetical protein
MPSPSRPRARARGGARFASEPCVAADSSLLSVHFLCSTPPQHVAALPASNCLTPGSCCPCSPSVPLDDAKVANWCVSNKWLAVHQSGTGQNIQPFLVSILPHHSPILQDPQSHSKTTGPLLRQLRTPHKTTPGPNKSNSLWALPSLRSLQSFLYTCSTGRIQAAQSAPPNERPPYGRWRGRNTHNTSCPATNPAICHLPPTPLPPSKTRRPASHVDDVGVAALLGTPAGVGSSPS